MLSQLVTILIFLVGLTIQGTECQWQNVNPYLMSPHAGAYQNYGLLNTGMFPQQGYLPTPGAMYPQQQAYPYGGLNTNMGLGMPYTPYPYNGVVTTGVIPGMMGYPDQGSISVDVKTPIQPPQQTTIIEQPVSSGVMLEQPAGVIVGESNHHAPVLKHMEQYAWGRNMPTRARGLLPILEEVDRPSHHIRMPFQVQKPWHQEVYTYYKK